jgi:hypothetical protein
LANSIPEKHRVSPSHVSDGSWTFDPALPLISLVLAATAVPIDLRFESFALTWAIEPFDVIANLIGYIPVGIVLARLGPGRAVALATLIAMLAESTQLFAMFRFVSPLDVVWNAGGAAIGVLVSTRWKARLPPVPLTRRACAVAALGAFMIVALNAGIASITIDARRSSEELTVNTRGADAPGSLEARWKFDDGGTMVAESSGRPELQGRVLGDSTRVPGVFGTAIQLEGNDYVDFGTPAALRLTGSMTVTAWINAADFPADDAAIVSAHLPGYQLDTSIDKGPRTVAFKLVDPCGNSMARYGRTELKRDDWYFVAGVYDAAGRAIHVYVNGNLDDGPSTGDVVARQEPSGEHVYVGHRPEPLGYGFIGRIDDVRIYSEALNAERIAELHATSDVAVDAPRPEPLEARRADVMSRLAGPSMAGCRAPTSPRDSVLPALLVVAGMLTAVASVASRRATATRAVVVGCLVPTALLLPATAVFLPTRLLWLVPVLTLAGAAATAAALRVREQHFGVS